jgi:hypothetical protein
MGRRLPALSAVLKACRTLVVVGGLYVVDAAALTITVKTAGDTQAPSTVTALMRRVDGDVPARALELPVGASTVVDDAGTHTWEITVSSTTLWAAPVYASGTEAVTLQLWPLGTLRGKIAKIGSPASDGEIIVSFAPPADESTAAGVVTCPFEGTDWRCPVPAGVSDLRFNLTGFATEFRWSVKVGEATDVGTLTFTPGSSVFGKVQLLSGSRPDLLKDIEISLTPLNVDEARGPVPRYTTAADARGFFQVRGLRPGNYSLRARSKSSELLSETRTVAIIQHTNAALKEPLVLARPTRLSVRITPALDVQHRRWQVALLRTTDLSGTLDVVDQSLASAKGEWSQRRILPGEYRLEIQQEDGAEWKVEEFTVRSEDADRVLDIAVSSQRVAGQVTLGDRPIAARVQLGGENGPALVADQSGDFEGELPSFTGDETVLFVTSETPHVQRTLTVKGDREADATIYFRIKLPATAVTGRTVNEDGSPEPAIVTLRAKDENEERLFEQMFSEKDGAFQFEGFAPGRYALQADSFQKASAVVDVEITHGVAPALDLVLRPQEQVRGLISMNGVPVAGADVYAMPRDTKTSLLHRVTSDAAGRFVLTLPPGTNTYDVIVFPRGFYITAARITRDPKEGLRVSVGQDGGSLSVDAPDDQTRLYLGHAGGEYPLPWVVDASGGTTSIADGRRRLTVPNLESGTYKVCRKAACESVYVPRFATALVTLDEVTEKQ